MFWNSMIQLYHEEARLGGIDEFRTLPPRATRGESVVNVGEEWKLQTESKQRVRVDNNIEVVCLTWDLNKFKYKFMAFSILCLYFPGNFLVFIIEIIVLN